MVACGFNFLVAEAEEGLWVLGNNDKGQLGLGHTNSALQPTYSQLNCSEGPLRCLTASFVGVILIDSQGGVFSAGDDSQDQLARSSGEAMKLQHLMNIPPMLAASCGCFHTLCLDESGGVWTWGHGGAGQLGTSNTFNQSQPALVPSLKDIRALTAGGFHSLAFPQEGGLLVFGSNEYGQLGLNHTTDQSTPTVIPVHPGVSHSLTHSRNKSARFL